MTTLPPHAQKSNSYLIYALIDPRNCSTRYIGVTNDMYRRYQEHINCRDKNEGKNAWVGELRQSNFLPIMRAVEVVDTVKYAKLREKYWIAHYASMGEQLFNFECEEPVIEELTEVDPPDLTTVRKPTGRGRKFDNATVKSIIQYYLRYKAWPDEIDTDMQSYYRINYIQRSGKYYVKTKAWRAELREQTK